MNINPAIRINVEPTNPGQVLACCGLFEIADRLWPGSEGWFENGRFCLDCDLDVLFSTLVESRITNTMTTSEIERFKELSSWSGKRRKASPGVENEFKALSKLLRESPILINGRIGLTLDWFVDVRAGGSRFKTWAGQQSVLTIATSMKDALTTDDWRHDDCLRYFSHECGLPFNFDSDLGVQGGAIDVGFSFDPLASSALTRIESMARPALELFAFIGLQRFRPREIKGENRFLFTLWSEPLLIQTASPVFSGFVPRPKSRFYEFRLLYRTKYLKSFLPAFPVLGDFE